MALSLYSSMIYEEGKLASQDYLWEAEDLKSRTLRCVSCMQQKAPYVCMFVETYVTNNWKGRADASIRSCIDWNTRSYTPIDDSQSMLNSSSSLGYPNASCSHIRTRTVETSKL